MADTSRCGHGLDDFTFASDSSSERAPWRKTFEALPSVGLGPADKRRFQSASWLAPELRGGFCTTWTLLRGLCGAQPATSELSVQHHRKSDPPPAPAAGRPRRMSTVDRIELIMWMCRAGCPWSMLPCSHNVDQTVILTLHIIDEPKFSLTKVQHWRLALYVSKSQRPGCGKNSWARRVGLYMSVCLYYFSDALLRERLKSRRRRRQRCSSSGANGWLTENDG